MIPPRIWIWASGCGGRIPLRAAGDAWLAVVEEVVGGRTDAVEKEDVAHGVGRSPGFVRHGAKAGPERLLLQDR